ncbi:MAG: ferredoxin [Bdellovibrionales bacterium]
MADKSNKFEDNVPGRFYVDKECIACDACVLAAPDHFKMHEEDGHAFVAKQPDGEAEEAACREAMEGCPVEAIGNDGSSP